MVDGVWSWGGEGGMGEDVIDRDFSFQYAYRQLKVKAEMLGVYDLQSVCLSRSK